MITFVEVTSGDPYCRGKLDIYQKNVGKCSIINV